MRYEQQQTRALGRRIGVAGLGVALAALAGAGSAAAISGTDTIRTYAGNGQGVSSGDGQPAVSAGVRGPIGISATPGGGVVIPAPDDNRVRFVNTARVISTIAGTGVAGFSGDDGPATAAQLSAPVDSAVDGAGNIYIADRGNHRVRKISPAGIITTIAGNGVNGFGGDNGPATAAQLNNPVGVAVDAAGNVYIADELNHRVRRVGTDGIITTVVGTGVAGSTGDGGPATAATLQRPIDVRVDRLGDLYIADIAANRIRRVAPDGVITTAAGNGNPGLSGDGTPATAAQIPTPIEIVPDPFGNLYIASTAADRVIRVNAGGVISTIAGNGVPGFTGDGGPAIDAQLHTPAGVALNPGGDLLIADRANNRVRMVVNPLPASAIPAGTSQCARVPARPTRSSRRGTVTLSAKQLLINQRISQAAVRRVNGVQEWLDDGLVTDDLCGGAFVAQSFGPGIVVGSTSAPRPEAALPPRPRPVSSAPGRRGKASAVKLEASQLLISQRISQAAVRRANALTARLDAGLTGGDLRTGAVTPAKIAVGLTVVSAALAPTPAPSRTVVKPARRGRPAKVALTAGQILINQRIAQAAVRRSNALVDRIRAGFGAEDFRSGTVTATALAPSLR